MESVNRGNAEMAPTVTGDAAGGPEGPGPDAARVPLRELMDDRLLDALLDRSRDTAGGCG